MALLTVFSITLMIFSSIGICITISTAILYYFYKQPIEPSDPSAERRGDEMKANHNFKDKPQLFECKLIRGFNYAANVLGRSFNIFHCNSKLNLMSNLIDDWYMCTLFLPFFAFGYLVYVLFFDISEMINEERRYLLKMQSAGFVLKSFYYVMRLFKVPIF